MSKIAYLTIDDAPSKWFLHKVAWLDENHIPVVWFCQGSRMEQRPHMIIDAIKRGHIIGNHSYSHPRFDDISLNQGCAEIRATDALIDEFHAKSGVPRPPFHDETEAPHGLDHPQKIITQFDARGEWWGLNDDQSADLILVHDFNDDRHQEFFVPMITRLLEKGIQFRQPL